MTDQTQPSSSEPNPVGRPTAYRPEYCDEIIELGREGKSLVQFANHFEVIKQTLINWSVQHPEFLVALTRAKQLSQEWWEKAAQNNLLADKFQASLWSRSMAARFPEDYREKQDINLGGQKDNPVVTIVGVLLPDNARGDSTNATASD